MMGRRSTEGLGPNGALTGALLQKQQHLRRKSASDALAAKIIARVSSSSAEGELEARRCFAFSKLPFDLQEYVLRFLPSSEMGMSCAVCKSWSHVYQGAVGSIFADIVGVARGKSRLMRHAEMRLIHRLRHTHIAENAIEMLLWGAYNGFTDYVVRLLQKESKRNVINVNSAGPEEWDGATALHVASRQGDAELVRTLVEMGADPNLRTRQQRTPLILAAEQGNGVVVETLLGLCGDKMDIDAVDNQGRTALFCGCEKASTLVVFAILDWAAKKMKTEGLASFPVDVNLGTIEWGSPLNIACKTGHVKTVERLLDVDCHVNIPTRDGRTSLFVAVEGGKVNTTRILLEKRPPVNAKEMAQKIYEAQPRFGMQRAVEEAMTATEIPGIDPSKAGILVDLANDSGKTPLFVASERGNSVLVEILVNAGVDVSKPTYLNKTPLYAATENGHTQVVRQLLEKSTREDVLKQTNFGTTALFMAQRNGNHDIKALLTEFCVAQMATEKAMRKKSKVKQTAYMERLTTLKKKDTRDTSSRSTKKTKKKGARMSNDEQSELESTSSPCDALTMEQKVENEVASSKERVEKLTSEIEELEKLAKAPIRKQPRPLEEDSGFETNQSQEQGSFITSETKSVNNEAERIETTKPECETPETDTDQEYGVDTVMIEGAPESKVDTRNARVEYFQRKFAEQISPAEQADERPSKDGKTPHKEKEMEGAPSWSQRRREGEGGANLESSKLDQAIVKFSQQNKNCEMTEDVYEELFHNAKARHIFDAVKNQGQNSANARGFFVGASLFATEEEPKKKLARCFKLFDTESKGFVDLACAERLLDCCVQAAEKIHRKERTTSATPQQLAREVARFDLEGTEFTFDTVEKEQFIEWALHSRNGQQLLSDAI